MPSQECIKLLFSDMLCCTSAAVNKPGFWFTWLRRLLNRIRMADDERALCLSAGCDFNSSITSCTTLNTVPQARSNAIKHNSKQSSRRLQGCSYKTNHTLYIRTVFLVICIKNQSKQQNTNIAYYCCSCTCMLTVNAWGSHRDY